MAQWILENWQILASAGLAAANLLLTLLVHRSSRKRITKLEDENGDGIPDQLEELLRLNQKLLEALKSAKSPESSTKEESL